MTTDATGGATQTRRISLLIVDDHAARRRLARTAMAEGWSVRRLESQAREANGAAKPASGPSPSASKAPAKGLHPDQEEAMHEIAQTLGAAFGAEVRVRPSGTGFKVELDVADQEEAAALAARLTR